MDDAPTLALNPALDRPALARAFAERSRLQIRDVLTGESARAILVLLQASEWNLSWRVLGSKPNLLPASTLGDGSGGPKAAIEALVAKSVPERDGVTYVCRDRVLGRDATAAEPGTPHAKLFEGLSGSGFLDLVRDVTGHTAITHLSARATLFEPGHFLSIHHDGVEDGRHFAFVLNLTSEEWRPDWGGYLLFYDADGEVIEGFKPRFNSLNIFRVPQIHAVPAIAPSAPVARYAISGWFFDR